jgi:hypothetical protein
MDILIFLFLIFFVVLFIIHILNFIVKIRRYKSFLINKKSFTQAGFDIVFYVYGCVIGTSILIDIYQYYKANGTLPKDYNQIETLALLLFRIRQANNTVTKEDLKKYPNAPTEFDQKKANDRKREKQQFDEISKQFKRARTGKK